MTSGRSTPDHQAGLVVCDIVGSDKTGFIADEKRLAVMTTRAQVLTIMVGQESFRGRQAQQPLSLSPHQGSSFLAEVCDVASSLPRQEV